MKNPFDAIMGILGENLKGRKIVLLGDSTKFRESLRKNLGLEVDCVATRRTDLLQKEGYRKYSDFQGMREEYYIVIPFLKYVPKEYEVLAQYGYQELEDFLYYYHKPVAVKATGEEYQDVYGNRILGSVKGSEIIFNGYQSVVTFGKGIFIRNQLKIHMWTGSELIFKDSICFNDESLWKIGAHSHVLIEEKCGFNKAAIRTISNVKIHISERCTFGPDLEFACASGTEVILGKDCMFSSKIIVQAADSHSIFDVRQKKNINSVYQDLPEERRRIVLGDHVWVGKRSMLMYSTDMGSGSVVGASSVVKGKFPNNCIVAGVPARQIKKDIAWSRVNSAEDISICPKEYVCLTDEASIPWNKTKQLGGGTAEILALKREIAELKQYNIRLQKQIRQENWKRKVYLFMCFCFCRNHIKTDTFLQRNSLFFVLCYNFFSASKGTH